MFNQKKKKRMYDMVWFCCKRYFTIRGTRLGGKICLGYSAYRPTLPNTQYTIYS